MTNTMKNEFATWRIVELRKTSIGYVLSTYRYEDSEDGQVRGAMTATKFFETEAAARATKLAASLAPVDGCFKGTGIIALGRFQVQS